MSLRKNLVNHYLDMKVSNVSKITSHDTDEIDAVERGYPCRKNWLS